MGIEENKELVRRLYDEVVNRGLMNVADELVHIDAIEHEPIPGAKPGREGFKQFFEAFRKSFPDMQISIDDMIAENDKVVVRLTVRGTHDDDFMGISSTGNPIEFESIDIFRCEGGLLVEHWGETDTLGLFKQLNALPPMDD